MQDFGIFVSGPPKFDYSSAGAPPTDTLTLNGKPIPWGTAFFIAAVVTLSSLFTYYLPDNLPDSDPTNIKLILI